MRAITVPHPGGPEQLTLSELPVPALHEDQVLIRVTAAGLNRADTLQREGHYPPPPGASELLGLEVSGTISEVGPTASRWKIGDRVCALLAGGGYAEYCAAPAVQCLPVPDSLSLTDAAALPEAAFTVWANLFHQPLVHRGEKLFVQGGSVRLPSRRRAHSASMSRSLRAARRSSRSVASLALRLPSPTSPTGSLKPRLGPAVRASTSFWT